jgi:hypothetical protein
MTTPSSCCRISGRSASISCSSILRSVCSRGVKRLSLAILGARSSWLISSCGELRDICLRSARWSFTRLTQCCGSMRADVCGRSSHDTACTSRLWYLRGGSAAVVLSRHVVGAVRHGAGWKAVRRSARTRNLGPVVGKQPARPACVEGPAARRSHIYGWDVGSESPTALTNLN